ncbi:fungal-specific transcription factor domain-containing protein [Aspergillus karnatakaensis]|uniref:transcription factor domain-containing protein n=1 Tax=Aspergillus karnatakaensis TaxID=1810916 RepID=UPI003CCDC6F9
MEQLHRKRRRVIAACLTCRSRKSRCSGGRPECSRCSELGLACQYPSVGTTHEPPLRAGNVQLLALEDRLNQVESLLRETTAKRSRTEVDEPHHRMIPNFDTPYDGPAQRFSGSDDATDGMGHFVFGNEEDRAYFGPSSNIAFASDLSRALKRLSRNRGEVLVTSHAPPMLDIHVAQVSPPTSPVLQPVAPCPATSGTQKGLCANSIFYLPPDLETTALIDRYFANTGLLYPYLHEETFRETYTRLKDNRSTTRRTWLGLLNMVLALATQTSESDAGEKDDREAQSHAYYRRANGLCAEYIIRGTSLEIVQYLLLVSQYKQGTRSSIEAWTTHGLAVKVALQLGLHSAESSKRFPAVEREIRKRTWFGCIVLDRTLSTAFGRPASIPEHYSRLEPPVYFDLIEPRARQVEARQRCRYSTDFFNATIRLYSILGQAVDLLYDGNLGSEERIANYELISRILRMRHLLQEWPRELPAHMALISASNVPSQLGKNATIDRFRLVLTLRFHNLRILVHRVVLGRLCDTIGDHDEQNQETLALQDISRSTIQITLESATEIINTVRGVVGSQRLPYGLLGVWWFTLYYTFDAALAVFAVFLLAARSTLVAIPPPHSLSSLKHSFLGCIDALHQLDEENGTIQKCCQCLDRLAEVWDIIESTAHIPSSSNPQLLPDYSTLGVLDQDASFTDFTFMTHELFDVTDGFLSNQSM